VLWAQIVRGCCADDAPATATRIHVRTSRFTKSAYASHVNLLRATTEAMAAVFGGADSLHVSPFDEPLGLPSELARRLARNTHAILREESHLDRVIDPAGGSWCVEALTAAVAERAWSIFQEIEAAGGLRYALETGEIQGRIAAVADERAENVATGRDVLVGVNRYPDATEMPPARRDPPYRTLHRRRAAELQRQRAAPAGEDRRAALARLEELRSSDGAELFEQLVSAAERGATLGEVTSALRLEAAPGPQVAPLAARRAAEPYERLRAAVQQRGATDAASVQVFLCCLGDAARYQPRLDFVRGFFQIGGFDVRDEGSFETPTEAADAARRSGAAIAVLVGRDESYAELAEATVRKLKRPEERQVVMLAGYPREIAPELERTGVARFLRQGSNALAELRAIAADCGVVI
jgi:methylmalonyl-CoA mutase